MAALLESELERLREQVIARLQGGLRPSPFLDNLIDKTVSRYPPLAELEAVAEDEEAPEPEGVRLAELDGGAEGAVAFVLRELGNASQSPYFGLVEQVAVDRDDQALERLMGLLDRSLKLRGILFRHRLDPDAEYPAIWGKVWEAIPKWDGRDFRAYIARIVRNHCLDEIARKKRAPGSMEEDQGDGRPRGRTAERATTRDAVRFVLSVLDELEASGRIKALDGVIFALISQGRSVADIVAGFRASGVPARLARAFALFGGRLDPSDVVVLRSLLEGLTSDEVALVTGRDAAQVADVAAAVEPDGLDDPDDRLVADALIREGLSVSDLERAQRLTTNAVNLLINRTRLKMWMALVDRAYEALRRRGEIDDVDLAVVQHRCTLSPPAGCRMYKDHTCKREADAADIARRGGLDLDGPAVARRMAALRRKVIEDGLGLVFPDYNSCLIERKPARGKAS